ncbi:hypothetical protein R5R35_003264 [Gryllus longicercus]|uniref:Takeout n=1 Tax=Gryllus longicercus TaxID=2509291 RepID=A0AAN9VY79_9ORTH
MARFLSTVLAGAAALLLAGDLSTGAPNKLPPQFKLCTRDEKLTSCLEEAFVVALHQLAPGLPEFGIPSLDPLHLPEIGVGDETSNSPVNLRIHLTDILVHNLKTAKPSNTKADLDNYQLSTHGIVNLLGVEADYVMDGRILLLPAKGKGRVSFNVTNLEGDAAFKGEKQIKKGKEYLKINQFDFRITHIESVNIYFDNLFNGDKTLGPPINKLINENWQEIWSQVQLPLQELLQYTFKEFARRIFDKVPMDDVFLQKTR